MLRVMKNDMNEGQFQRLTFFDVLSAIFWMWKIYNLVIISFSRVICFVKVRDKHFYKNECNSTIWKYQFT